MLKFFDHITGITDVIEKDIIRGKVEGTDEQRQAPACLYETRLNPLHKYQYQKASGIQRIESCGEIYQIGLIYLHESHDVRNRTNIKKKNNNLYFKS